LMATSFAKVLSVNLRTFVLCPPEEGGVLIAQGLSCPDHLKSLLSWVLVLKFVHIQITPRSPLGRRDMPQSGGYQHQSEPSVREVANNPGSPPDFTVHPFQCIVCPNPNPVIPREGHVGQRFVDDFLQGLGRRHAQACHGYRMLHGSLLLAGWWVNPKKERRLCRLHGLSQPQRRKRKRRGAAAGMPCRAEYLNHVWSCEFVSDSCDNGRKLRFFTVIEEYTRVCLAVEVNTGFNHLQVIRVMEDLIRMFGAPKFLRADNGSEFIAKALVRWLKYRMCNSGSSILGHPGKTGGSSPPCGMSS